MKEARQGKRKQEGNREGTRSQGKASGGKMRGVKSKKNISIQVKGHKLGLRLTDIIILHEAPIHRTEGHKASIYIPKQRMI